MLTLQQIIQSLTSFWEKKGCIIHQGYDIEVGAGTFNPATFLRCLGPEPYNTAYVEPSRRPGDGRYGINPNRIQLFHQFQVILKPSPSQAKELYLASLQALGFALAKHDIRFVHDDWESPTLGAWGLGWEVWCDGMEVTQFTYFQAIGSIPLPAVSAEITYGLERLAMFLQNKESIFDVQWNEELTLKDIIHASEVEWSCYNFEESDATMWMRHFQDFEAEAKKTISKKLPIPAYDFVLKASHAFNMLDARGAISVTERTGYIARIRELARSVAQGYLSSREEKGFPLLKKPPSKKKKPSLPKITKGIDTEKKNTFLLEIGSEQLPASFVSKGMKNLEKDVTTLLLEHAIAFKQVKAFGTPQRLALVIEDLAEASAEKTTEKKGPALAATFTADGSATAQGIGFFKAIGLTSIPTKEAVEKGQITGLEIRSIKEIDYLFFTLTQQGICTHFLLSSALPQLIANLDFPKKMRWGLSEISYARPLRWITALYGRQVIPFYVDDIPSQAKSRGHEQLCPKTFTIPHAKDYEAELEKHYVIACCEKRKAIIEKQLHAIEKKTDSVAVEREKVLNQVVNLTEWPKLFYAEFDEKFLKAPPEVLICEMVEHQKYFPLATKQGALRNLFVITADNTPSSLIRKGNQKVLSARLSDGVFLYESDLKHPLASFNDKLKVMTFQQDLGSMYDKVQRVTLIVDLVAKALAVAEESSLMVAASLCKADLATQLVGEFPELQGTIGSYYARAQHISTTAAEAIKEHWMPIAEGASLPKTKEGLCLSIADKIDNLLCYFSIGMKPTSSSDPYALRRQTFGILKMLIAHKKVVDLSALISSCCARVSIGTSSTVADIMNFFASRARSVFEDMGFSKDETEACLKGVCIDPYDVYCRLVALKEFRKNEKEKFHDFQQIYKRASGILKISANGVIDPTLFKEAAEKRLCKALEEIEEAVLCEQKQGHYLAAYQRLAGLQPLVADFFDTVKIHVDDEPLRYCRIALVQRLFTLFDPLLDFSKIQ